MNNYSYLVVEFETFKSNVEKALMEAKQLLLFQVEDATYMIFEQNVAQWKKETEELLSSSFFNPNNQFVDEFRNVRGNPVSHFPGGQISTASRVERQMSELQNKIDYLIFNLKIINVCEYIAQGKRIELADRTKYTTQEKLNLLLNKLYQLDDDNYYPIQMILEGNGIPPRNSYEYRELAEYLHDNGYIERLGGIGEDITARITSTGRMYVEEQGMAHVESYDDVPDSQDEINTRIDEIIAKLTHLGNGQEIIFEELQELKEAYAKLNKKNWGQLLKGKLMDIALEKLTDNDTIKFIYEKLTGHETKSIG